MTDPKKSTNDGASTNPNSTVTLTADVPVGFLDREDGKIRPALEDKLLKSVGWTERELCWRTGKS